MLELMEHINWENSVYFDLVKRSGVVKYERGLHVRIEWRERRILELESENDFDTLALETLRRGPSGQRSSKKKKKKKKDNVLREAFFGKRQAGF